MKLNMLLPAVITLLFHYWGTAAELSFAIEDAVGRALTNNIELAAARLGIVEAQARLRQSGRWSNPELESEFKPNVRGREGALTVGFSQRFPLTSRLRLERNLSRANLKLAQAEVEEAERKLALEVRLASVHLAAVEAQRGLKDRQISNTTDLASSARRAATAGEGSDTEASQLELDVALLATRQLNLDAERAAFSGELRRLLVLPGEIHLQIENALPMAEIVEAISLNPERRPDYRVATSRIEAAGHSVKLAEASRWEDASFGIFGEVERSEDFPRGIESEKMIGFRFSIPLPLWNKRHGQVDEARAVAARTEKEAEALLMRMAEEATTNQEQMRIAANLARSLAADVLPKARDLEVRLSALQKEGQATFADVLRARERRLELEVAELDARRNFHLARARHLAVINANGRQIP